MMLSYFSIFLFAFQAAGSALYDTNSPAISRVSTGQWAKLNKTVGGRLAQGLPLAAPCYSQVNGRPNLQADPSKCEAIQAQKTSSPFLTTQFGTYIYTEWASCIASSQSCPTDFEGSNITFPVHANCMQGSVPPKYIAVSGPSDVQAGINFARANGIPIVVKNTGHDFRGRSASQNALALWTHTYQPPIKLTKRFIPAGCSVSTSDAVTFGAGQQFDGIYQFAEVHNITIVGGGTSTVGAAGGWITGGGHSPISPTLGLGVDNTLELKAVLPNGTYISASRCQNPEIFYALRGGGGSTFGVVTEVSTKVHPKMTFQYARFNWTSLTPSEEASLIGIMTANANKWADQGFGGYVFRVANGFNILILTPLLKTAAAQSTLKPLFDFQPKKQVSASLKQYDSFSAICHSGLCYFVNDAANVGSVGSSRLIPRTAFDNNRAKLTETIADILTSADAINDTALPLFINLTPPNPKFVKDDKTSSVTPAWRQATWHLFTTSGYADIATRQVMEKSFKNVHDRMMPLRDLTPGSGAYQNEADTYEPNHEQSFWGLENYQRLLKLKKKLDPDNLFTCHQCVGWESSDKRFACYPPPPS